MMRPGTGSFQNRAWARFAIVGCTGFLLDAALMALMLGPLQLALVVARPLAFVCAATSNWILNRSYTFAELQPTGSRSLEWLRFIVSALLSAIPNLGVFFVLMRFLPESAGGILLAMIAGILAGYLSNYLLARRWVYRSTNE